MRIRSRGRLPHWEADEGTYFVTFRLHDSLPTKVLQAFEAQRQDIRATAKAMGRELTEAERCKLARLFSANIQRYLNAGTGSCYMKDPRIARLVADALRHFDGNRYRLSAWCVMPNHVHVVFQAMPEHGLEEIVRSWKSFTARFANRVLGRVGPFWQREYYDHLIRNETEFWRIVDYVAKNPEKAGLKDWPWVEVPAR